MNLETLRRLTRWTAKISKAQQELSVELAQELARAEASNDPLGVHIYRARAAFRITEQGDKSKAGRRTELTLKTSFQEAISLGFKGPLQMWEHLMRCGLPDSPAPTKPRPPLPD